MASNFLLNFLFAIQKQAWRLLRPRTRGVKVMIFRANGDLLLVRNTYGRPDLFVLPGGGVRPFEDPAEAARREIREELGVEVTELSLLSRHASTAEGKRDDIFLFEGHTDAAPRVDGFELHEARFAAIGDLPAETSPATRRRIEERLGIRNADGHW